MHSSLRNNRGFTLIEVMVTMVIIGILMAIVLPSYKDYILRAAVPEATATLATKQVKLEQWFQDNRSYYAVGSTTACGLPADTTSYKYFSFSCVPSSATAYVITATGIGTGKMAGFSYTIDQSGNKVTTSVSSGWTIPSTPCWVTAKGGVC
jgi:type IV pilus assembly protein PilE